MVQNSTKADGRHGKIDRHVAAHPKDAIAEARDHVHDGVEVGNRAPESGKRSKL